MNWSSKVAYFIKTAQGELEVIEHHSTSGKTLYRWTISCAVGKKFIGPGETVDWNAPRAFVSDTHYKDAESALRDGLVVALGIPEQLVFAEHESFIQHSSKWPTN